MGDKSVSIWVRLGAKARDGAPGQVEALARELKYGPPEVKPSSPWVGFRRNRWAEDVDVERHALQFAQCAGGVTCAASVFQSDELYLVLADEGGVRSTIHLASDAAAPPPEASEPWRTLLGSDEKLRSLRELFQPDAALCVEDVLPYVGGLVGWRDGVSLPVRPPPAIKPGFAIEASPGLRLDGRTNLEQSVTVTLANSGAAAPSAELHVTGTAVDDGLLSIEGAEISGVWEEREHHQHGPPPYAVRVRAARFRPAAPPHSPSEPEALHATLRVLARRPGDGELLVQLRDPQSEVVSEVVRIPVSVRPPRREENPAVRFGRSSGSRAISGVLSFRAPPVTGLEAALSLARVWVGELVTARTPAVIRRYGWQSGLEETKVSLTPDLTDKRWKALSQPWRDTRAVSCAFGVQRGGRPDTSGSGFSFEWCSRGSDTALSIGLWQDGWGLGDAAAEGRVSRLAALFTDALRDREVLSGVVSLWAYRPTLPLEPTPFEVCLGQTAAALRATATLQGAVRAVVPGHLWLGANLSRASDAVALSRLAGVAQAGAGLHLQPKSLSDLAALEAALLPLDRRYAQR